MNLFSVAVVVFVMAVVLVNNKSEPVLLSQSSTSITAQARQDQPAVTVTVRGNRTSLNPADVWQVPNVIKELAAAGETINAAVDPEVIAIETVAAVGGIVMLGGLNNSALLQPTTKLGNRSADEPILSRANSNSN